jgi:hypothetical protein
VGSVTLPVAGAELGKVGGTVVPIGPPMELGNGVAMPSCIGLIDGALVII